ncbi:MAG TPA: N,N-dimethylformamidase beta subunit family domain-containing protein, partial [Planctomycetaceae bacterium]|nr:N,N-dimethylformamidase beta subunit family domain-containing protein [Planctomycetaceae bacterium]
MTDRDVSAGDPRISRRDVLKGALAGPLAAGTLAHAGAVSADSRRASLIADENRRAGARDWQLTYVRLDGSAIRCPWIEGYCSRQSVAAGETLQLMVSTNPPARFTVEIFRMGYYGGRGARLMTTLGPFEGRPQPDPEVGPDRLRECRWEPSAEITIPDDWPSGVYLGRLSCIPADGVRDPWQSYVVFIVRDDRPADVLFQCSDNTWQSYNRWPDRFSMYDDGEREWYTGPRVDVSFDRPYGKYRQIYENPQSLGSGEFLCWEFPLAFWLEQHGYDVTYCSNSDLVTPERGLKCKAFVSVAHDEYWDVRQYESVRAMIDSGVSALFLCGNAVNGVTPLRPSSDGRPNRIMGRAGMFGGLAAQGLPSPHEFEMTGPDEGLLMGARNVDPVNGGGDWICAKPEHWIFEGTGMQKGEGIPGLVGWEFHGAPPEINGLEVVAEGQALHGGTQPQHWTATVYPGPRGNFVFNAATIFWSLGLSSPPGQMLPWSHSTRPHGPDERVQRITHNLLRR